MRRPDSRRSAGRRPPDRFGRKPAPCPGSSNELVNARRQASVPHLVALPRRTDLTELLGRTVLEARVQQICREWGLIPYAGSGLSRSYVAHDAGAELAADGRGLVTSIFLHFHGDDGFRHFDEVIPGTGGTIARRAHLWSALGRPGESLDVFLGDHGPSDTWWLPRFVLNARYTIDGDHVQRITLTLPDHPRAP
jgi:hypothetical protein